MDFITKLFKKEAQRPQEADPRLVAAAEKSAIGVSLMKAGNFKDAEPSLRMALRAAPEVAEHNVNFAIVLLAQAYPLDFPKAELHLKKAIDLFGADRPQEVARCYRYLSRALELQDKPDEAQMARARAAELDPDSVELCLEQGDSLSASGKPMEAWQAYAKALNMAGQRGQTEMFSIIDRRIEALQSHLCETAIPEHRMER